MHARIAVRRLVVYEMVENDISEMTFEAMPYYHLMLPVGRFRYVHCLNAKFLFFFFSFFFHLLQSLDICMRSSLLNNNADL